MDVKLRCHAIARDLGQRLARQGAAGGMDAGQGAQLQRGHAVFPM